MKAKKKRVWDWCTQSAIHLPDIGSNLCTMNKQRKEVKVPSKVKCPLCKKKFKPRVRPCSDRGCWHAYVPPHKVLK